MRIASVSMSRFLLLFIAALSCSCGSDTDLRTQQLSVQVADLEYSINNLSNDLKKTQDRVVELKKQQGWSRIVFGSSEELKSVRNEADAIKLKITELENLKKAIQSEINELDKNRPHSVSEIIVSSFYLVTILAWIGTGLYFLGILFNNCQYKGSLLSDDEIVAIPWCIGIFLITSLILVFTLAELFLGRDQVG